MSFLHQLTLLFLIQPPPPGKAPLPIIHKLKDHQYRARFIAKMFQQESGPPKLNIACRGCKDPHKFGTFRCSDCCFDSDLYCQECILHRHRQLPFHRPSELKQGTLCSYVVPRTLHSLGYRLRLGHSGRLCINAVKKGRDLVIAHTNGIHTLTVDWCSCLSTTQGDCLFDHGLFPATDITPQTAFSFEVLESFAQMHIASKISADAYYSALVQLTDKVVPSKVPVSYAGIFRIR